MNTPTNSELRQKLIQLYEKGADSVLIDWKRDDTKPLIEEIEALIDEQIKEAIRITWNKSGKGWNAEYTGMEYDVEEEIVKSVLDELRTTK